MLVPEDRERLDDPVPLRTVKDKASILLGCLTMTAIAAFLLFAAVCWITYLWGAKR